MNAQCGVVRGHDDECVPPQRESGSPGRTRARGDPDRATGDRRAGCGAPVAPRLLALVCKVCPRSRDSTLVYLKKNGTYSQSGDPPTLTGRHRFESVPLTLFGWHVPRGRRALARRTTERDTFATRHLYHPPRICGGRGFQCHQRLGRFRRTGSRARLLATYVHHRLSSCTVRLPR